jgi:hypothetical protein
MGCSFVKKTYNKWPKRTVNPNNQVILIGGYLRTQYYPLSLRKVGNMVEYNYNNQYWPTRTVIPKHMY